jgi:predicted RNA binding protein YcfA (HicA-like mRNA interferase family)
MSDAIRSVANVAKKFREVRRALRDAGWVQVRQAGSHETWRSDDGRVVTVAGKDSDTVPVGTLSAIRRATGIESLR